MIALLVVLAVLWLAYVIIDSMGPVGIMLVLGGIVVAFLTMGCAMDTHICISRQTPWHDQIRHADDDDQVTADCGR